MKTLRRRGAHLVLSVMLLASACSAPVVRGLSDAAPAEAPPLEPPPPDAGPFTLPEVPPAPPDAAPALACGALVASVRDFKTSHPDFEKDALNVGVLFLGLVEPELGPDGKPVHAAPGPTPTTTGPANFDQWYRDVRG